MANGRDGETQQRFWRVSRVRAFLLTGQRDTIMSMGDGRAEKIVQRKWILKGGVSLAEKGWRIRFRICIGLLNRTQSCVAHRDLISGRAQDGLVFLMTTRTDSVVPTKGHKLPVTSKTSPLDDIEGLAVDLFVMGAAVTGSVRPPQLFSTYGTVHVRSSAEALGPCGPDGPETLKGAGLRAGPGGRSCPP